MSKRMLQAVVVGLLLGGVGCAYFNIFYNANKYFNEAENLREAGGSGDASYKRAIDKCHALLRYHPDSGYVDDALFMIGLSHFHLEEYVQSQAALTDLLERFPDSDFVERSWFYLGMDALRLGDAGAAAAAFDGLESGYPNSRLLVEAEYRAAEVQLDKSPEIARQELQAFIDKYPKSEFAREAQLQVARTFYNEARYQEATAAYQAALKRGLSKGLEYEARLRIALSLREQAEVILSDPDLYEARDLPPGLVVDLGQEPVEFTTANTLSDSARAERQRAEDMLEEAARQLTEQRKEAEKTGNLAQHDIEMAVTRALQGSPGRAIADLDVIARAHPRLSPAVLAYYEIGEIHRRQGELDKARESYNESARQGNSNPSVQSQARKKAQAITERSDAMTRLKTAREVIAEREQSQGLVAPPAGADSVATLALPDPRKSAENQVRFEELANQLMRIAEIDLVELDQPRLALREYQMVLSEFDGSSQGPRAAFAIAWIYEHRLDDRGRALQAYRAVLNRFPGSPQARDAQAVVTAMSTQVEGG